MNSKACRSGPHSCEALVRIPPEKTCRFAGSAPVSTGVILSKELHDEPSARAAFSCGQARWSIAFNDAERPLAAYLGRRHCREGTGGPGYARLASSARHLDRGPAPKLIAIGDVHGDYKRLVQMLSNAEVALNPPSDR